MSLTEKQKSEGILGAGVDLLAHANQPADAGRAADWARHFGFVSERVDEPGHEGNPHRGTYVERLRVVDPATREARYVADLNGEQIPMPTDKLAIELLYADTVAAQARAAAGHNH